MLTKIMRSPDIARTGPAVAELSLAPGSWASNRFDVRRKVTVPGMRTAVRADTVADCLPATAWLSCSQECEQVVDRHHPAAYRVLHRAWQVRGGGGRWCVEATARGGGLALSERARPLRPGLLQPRLCPARGTPHSATISDLDKNRALLEWLRRQVGQTEHRIRELEIQEAQERERARAEMSWKIQPQRSSSVALLHRGGCATYPDQVGLISREDAMIALAEPDIEPCQVL